MLSVYLAGPIKGTSYNEAVDWRTDVTGNLLRSHISSLSPMRYKEFLSGSPSLDGGSSSHLTSHKGIVARDLNDIRRADAVLVNFTGVSSTVSMGTVAEIGFAHALNKMIIMAIEPEGNVHNYFFIKEMAGFVLPTLEQAVEIVKQVLLP